MTGLTQQQQAVLLSLFEPMIKAIVKEVVVSIPTAPPVTITPRYYTRQEVCAMIHVTQPTLTRLINDKLIKAHKVGNRVLIEADSLDEAITSNKSFRYKKR